MLKEKLIYRGITSTNGLRENHASSGSAQSITGQRNISCSDHIHMLMDSSHVAECCCMDSSVVDQQGGS